MSDDWSNPPPSERLAAWLHEQRWFGGKSRRISGIEVADAVPLDPATLYLLRVTLDDGAAHRYAVPLSAGAAPADAFDDPRFAERLVGLIADGARVPGRAGVVSGHRTGAFPAAPGTGARRLEGEQSNTSVVIGDTLLLKLFRRVADGVNPELELGRFLTETARFAHTPALAGWLEYGDATLAVVQMVVREARDGWQWTLGALASDARRAAAVPAFRRLGEVTAALHLALSRAATPALAVEPIAEDDVARWTAAVLSQASAARAAAPGVEVDVSAVAVGDALASLRSRAKCRHHGDFHLGQTLYRDAGAAWTIIDFEGEPLRPVAERRQKHSPLRDVAGLLRSIAYAAETTRMTSAASWIDRWESDARGAYLSGYMTTAVGAPFLPERGDDVERVVAAFEVEKAAYEIVYEANNRPAWTAIPARGLARANAALASPRASGAA
jgi:trehalose synthase-fused probable maltokinase